MHYTQRYKYIYVSFLSFFLSFSFFPATQFEGALLNFSRDSEKNTTNNSIYRFESISNSRTLKQPLEVIESSFLDDSSPLDLLKGKKIQIEEISPINKLIKSKDGMVLIVYPLSKDKENKSYSFDRNDQIAVINLPNDFLLGIGETFRVNVDTIDEQQNYEDVEIATIPHLIGGKPFLGLVILSTRIRNKLTGETVNEKKYFEFASSNIIAESTFFGGRDSIYPNKLTNILIAVSYLAERQDTAGPFKALEGYSFNKISRLLGGDTLHYEYGKDNLWASGVCAVASLTSASLYQLSQETGVDYENSLTSIIRRKYSHNTANPYESSPFVTEEIDTTVVVSPTQIADLVWQMPADLDEIYIVFNVFVIPNGVEFTDTIEDGTMGLSDADLFITMAYSTENPGDQANSISSIVEDYRSYRKSRHIEIPPSLKKGTKVEYVDWDADNWLLIAETVLEKSL